jgi:2-oxoglutarate dehydrogenase complex dehydrogenase (E1) component-like enzyme
MNLVAERMAKEKRPKGRPKGAGRITFRYGIVASEDYQAWMRRFMEHMSEPEVSDLFRECVRRVAEAEGFESPPKR